MAMRSKLNINEAILYLDELPSDYSDSGDSDEQESNFEPDSNSESDQSGKEDSNDDGESVEPDFQRVDRTFVPSDIPLKLTASHPADADVDFAMPSSSSCANNVDNRYDDNYNPHP